MPLISLNSNTPHSVKFSNLVTDGPDRTLICLRGIYSNHAYAVLLSPTMCARLTSSRGYEPLPIYEILRPAPCLRARARVPKSSVHPMCPVRQDEYNFPVSRIRPQIHYRRLGAPLPCLDQQCRLVLSLIPELNKGSNKSIALFCM